MPDRDQASEDAYQIAVLSLRCQAGEHSMCTEYCECRCHQ